MLDVRCSVFALLFIFCLLSPILLSFPNFPLAIAPIRGTLIPTLRHGGVPASTGCSMRRLHVEVDRLAS